MTSILKPQTAVAPRQAAAFSMIELLIVIAIIGIIFGMVTTTTTRQIKAMDLTVAVSDVGSLMEEARQVALIENRDVQIRIYSYPVEMDSTSRFRAMAIGKVIPIIDPADPDYGDTSKYSFEPIGRLYRLPAGVTFIDSTTHSTLLTEASIATGTEAIPSDSGTAINATYRVFHITPHEGASLDTSATDPWTITLGSRFAESYATGLPINFATFTVSPQTGKATLTRP